MKRRIGRFTIAAPLIDTDCDQIMTEVMGACVVVRCEMLYAQGAFEYVAISPRFDEVDLGSEVPWYDVVLHEGGSAEFKRRL